MSEWPQNFNWLSRSLNCCLWDFRSGILAEWYLSQLTWIMISCVWGAVLWKTDNIWFCSVAFIATKRWSDHGNDFFWQYIASCVIQGLAVYDFFFFRCFTLNVLLLLFFFFLYTPFFPVKLWLLYSHRRMIVRGEGGVGVIAATTTRLLSEGRRTSNA